MIWLYFIQCNGDRGPVKIGYAANVHTRLSKIQNGCPYPMALRVSLLVADAKLAESRLHIQFATLRIRGEWFEWSQDIEDAIQRAIDLNGTAIDDATKGIRIRLPRLIG